MYMGCNVEVPAYSLELFIQLKISQQIFFTCDSISVFYIQSRFMFLSALFLFCI